MTPEETEKELQSLRDEVRVVTMQRDYAWTEIVLWRGDLEVMRAERDAARAEVDRVRDRALDTANTLSRMYAARCPEPKP